MAAPKDDLGQQAVSAKRPSPQKERPAVTVGRLRGQRVFRAGRMIFSSGGETGQTSTAGGRDLSYGKEHPDLSSPVAIRLQTPVPRNKSGRHSRVPRIEARCHPGKEKPAGTVGGNEGSGFSRGGRGDVFRSGGRPCKVGRRGGAALLTNEPCPIFCVSAITL